MEQQQQTNNRTTQEEAGNSTVSVPAMSTSSLSSSFPPPSSASAAESDVFDRAAALRVVGAAEQKDASVQGTSDDAAISKHSAMSLGYFRDEFLPLFVSPAHVSRRPPLINRGYWARVAAVNQAVKEFLEEGEPHDMTTTEQTTAPSFTPASSIPSSSPFSAPNRLPPPPFSPAPVPTIRKQILSLGAGSDTLYFKLKSAGRAPFRYLEVDFPLAAQRKANTIRRHARLSALIAEKPAQITMEEHEAALERVRERAASGDTNDASLALPSSDYTLFGCDLRDLTAFENQLKAHQFDFTLPTLILSECVLIYMPPTDSAALLKYLTSRLTGGCMVWTYEQIHPFDAFGQTMIQNLKNRGCSLLGFTAYPDLIAQQQRYMTAGFQYYRGFDMNDVYRYYLKPVSEVKRIERLELFDEFEEWNMIQAHYHVSVATKPPEKDALKEDDKARAINWATVGMLGCSKDQPSSVGSPTSPAAAAASNAGTVTLPNGKTILLGGAGIRASAPLKPSDANSNLMTHTATTGSLKKPTPATSSATTQ